ncbi:1,6-anhydro-N-acetylmuramyl-L-alanine amidase AmpD [Cognaticolwellia aestuarii]|uniref:1,6-anhydro-N-acetylmuramyl-L-alanine amidase AmpD n=1 Tax=Cognaticolwellia aestuarii TaxID=329993 RepID=UPI001930E8BF|nr:1,6-anhydro-N-acetylmuramyl-L-alanine amidase AmpD [Cognaticolwellia aestuarii]
MIMLKNSRTNSADWVIENGWLTGADIQPSSHFEPRDKNESISLLVVHNISLPPGQFGGNYITDFFLGRLDPTLDPYFETIYKIRVSAHCLIKRNGEVVQYVSFNDKAWHAGVSRYQNRDKCNDFSIGIELEGTDDIPYTKEQYQQLSQLSCTLIAAYPALKGHIVGHCDIAPDRKTDPGTAFDWQHFRATLESN